MTFPRAGFRRGALCILAMPTKRSKKLKSKKKALTSTAPSSRLARENKALKLELAEAREQQTATSEMLRVIASSPTNLQPVVDSVAENAARLCEANDAVIFRIDGDVLQLVAKYGPMPVAEMWRPIVRGSPGGRAVIDRQTIHIHDIAAEVETEFPEYKHIQQRMGTRTALATPLLREGVPIGVIFIRRTEVRPFSDKQIALLKTFADQSVIAIKNVRLYQELQARNRDLTEALEQQTATSEILQVIARSPTDIQPVLATVAESAARLCNANETQIYRFDGTILRLAANYGDVRASRELSITRGRVVGRAFADRKTIHVHDLDESAAEFPESHRSGHRTRLATPLLREGVPLGVIGIRRTEMRPFTESQIKLLETFADQAVIAIENVRLFQELKESLEQQTATSEILGVIASSPTDIQPVLNVVAENAARLCGASDANIRLRDGGVLRSVASFGPLPYDAVFLVNRGTAAGRAVVDGQTVHVEDYAAKSEDEFPEGKEVVQRLGFRTVLATPLLREGIAIGAIVIRRVEMNPFNEKQIKLLETFASQAVIAIENVRLFKELQDRNRQLTEALEQQTATSEILSVISSSPTDVQPVFDTIVKNAARLCEGSGSSVVRFAGEMVNLVAQHNISAEARDGMARRYPRHPTRESAMERAVLDSTVTHIPDVSQDPDFRLHVEVAGEVKALLAAPLLRDGRPIGAIGVNRSYPGSFTDKQIALLKTFADQAVIAIENVRLFKEIQERNAELREALEHQTATAEVLGIISRSPTDVQPVLDAIVESAAQVCGIDDVLLRLHEGNAMVARAHFGSIPIVRVEISIDEPEVRWMREHGTLHVPDTRAQNDFPMLGSAAGWRTLLSVPLRQHGEIIGNLNSRRNEVRPFTPAQIKLLETFADQAVIAIENVQLFQELENRNRDLTEALEQQTATSEILGVIASSPTDIQPVLNTVAANAARLCDANDAVVFRIDGDVLQPMAIYGPVPAVSNPISRGSTSGRAVIDRRTIHIPDLSAESEEEFPVSKAYHRQMGDRTTLATPLLREGLPIGAILIRRREVRPFSEKQIALLKTFADQAVIAIENVRLFKELKESLEQQTATSEILGVIASSPTDIQPVLDVVAENAARLCDATDAAIMRVDGDRFWLVASHGPNSIVRPDEGRPITRGRHVGRAIIDRKTIHIHDLSSPEAQAEFSETHAATHAGIRTVLVTPLF